jgi:hypothetical protein
MNFTSEGKKAVMTKEFIARMRHLVPSEFDYIGRGQALNAVSHSIAWVACGYEIRVPPTDSQYADLLQFVREHESEIAELVSKCFTARPQEKTK